jgi:long-chain acyl-CoA synthetase
MKSILQGIRDQLQRDPSKHALISNEGIWDYAQLGEEIRRFQAYFSCFGKDIGVLIMLDNRPETLAVMLAVGAGNGIGIPIDFNAHYSTFEKVYQHSGASCLVCTKPVYMRLKRFGELPSSVLLIDVSKGDKGYEAWQELRQEPLSDFQEADAGKMAFLMYTSGTTGPSKGVMLSLLNLACGTEQINAFIGTDYDTVESMPMPLSHSFGFARARCILDKGATLVLEKGMLKSAGILKRMQAYKVNAFSGVPAAFQILLTKHRQELKALGPIIRFIEIGSAPMHVETRRELMELFPNARICMHYGLTEASRSSFIEFHSDSNKLHTVGKPSPGVEIQILNEKLEILSYGKTGQIAIKGCTTMQGYFRDLERTKSAYHKGFLLTGDQGHFDEDGYLVFEGRQQDILNLGGLKAGCLEIEAVINGLDGILECAVIAASDSNHFYVRAFVVAEKELDPQELRKSCASYLEAYKIPEAWDFVERLPKTPNGKLIRAKLYTSN